MDEKDQELPEFSLEEILREFGAEEAPPQEPETAERQEEPELTEELETPEAEEILEEAEEADQEEPQEEPEQYEEREEANLVPDAQEGDEKDATVRLEDISELHEQQNTLEADFPPQPIPFRAKNRASGLKRQIIAGPEKRYYELTEVGVGKLQIAIFLSVLVTLLSAGATVFYALGMVPESRLKLMVFLQFFAMLFSAMLGSYQLMQGVTDLFHKRFTLRTMLVCTFLACIADGVLGLREQRIPCCATFSLEMTMCLWGALEKRVTERGQMDTLRKAVRLDSVVCKPDYYQGMAGVLRGEGQVEEFMEGYQAVSKPERAIDHYALAALAASIALGVVAGVFHGASFGVRVLAVSTLAAVPATFFVTLSRPMAVLEKRLHSVGTVLCGWKGVEELAKKVVFPVTYEDLFPVGSVMMNGVKFYGSRDTEQVIAYTAALIRAGSSGLAPIFDRVLDSRNGRRYDLESFQDYGNGGIGAEIGGEPVLVGVLGFMKEMGVEIPEGTRVNQAVYVAIDGELCGLFALNCAKDSAAAAGITSLCAYRGLKPVLTSVDFILTQDFVREKFGVNTKKILFPEDAERVALHRTKAPEDAPTLALVTRQGLASAAYAATGARAVRTASRVGAAVHILGGILGLGIMALLAVMGRDDLLTPVNLFLYQLVWMLPGLLITEWTRSI